MGASVGGGSSGSTVVMPVAAASSWICWSSGVRSTGFGGSGAATGASTTGAGGVGFYPVSNFVHVDTGRVRQWRGA